MLDLEVMEVMGLEHFVEVHSGLLVSGSHMKTGRQLRTRGTPAVEMLLSPLQIFEVRARSCPDERGVGRESDLTLKALAKSCCFFLTHGIREALRSLLVPLLRHLVLPRLEVTATVFLCHRWLLFLILHWVAFAVPRKEGLATLEGPPGQSSLLLWKDRQAISSTRATRGRSWLRTEISRNREMRWERERGREALAS